MRSGGGVPSVSVLALTTVPIDRMPRQPQTFETLRFLQLLRFSHARASDREPTDGDRDRGGSSSSSADCDSYSDSNSDSEGV